MSDETLRQAIKAGDEAPPPLEAILQRRIRRRRPRRIALASAAIVSGAALALSFWPREQPMVVVAALSLPSATTDWLLETPRLPPPRNPEKDNADAR